MQRSAVQCSTVQYSTVQYSTVQYSTVQDTALWVCSRVDEINVVGRVLGTV